MSDKNDINKIRRKSISSTDSNQANKRQKTARNYREDANRKNMTDRNSDLRNSRRDQYEKRSEDLYSDDIKTYNPRRSTRESRVKVIREASYKNDDKDLKMYNPKRTENKKRSENSDTKSSSKKSRIRIKKQASSGSGGRSNSQNEVLSKNNDKKKIIKFNPRDNEEMYYDEDEYYDDEPVKKKKHRVLRKVLKRIITILLILFVIGGSAGLLYVRSVISDMPVLTKKMVYESFINKDPVPLSEIPKTLQNAVIAVEDQRFYKHGGIDVRSVIRSFVNNLTNDSIQGGSTIDMQLSKNILTNNERTVKRKIQDMYNAIMLNKIMTKNEILDAYLNNIYMGKSAYGVQAGAQLYFGKDVSKLNFGQCTMLAGITNNPKLYQDYEQAKKRQAVVLYKMYKLGYIKEYVYKAQLYRDTPFKSEIDK